jgi:hypothetical protein
MSIFSHLGPCVCTQSPKYLEMAQGHISLSGREFKWDEKCQESFDQLKKRLISPPVLVMLDLKKGFDFYCDACD